MRVALVRVLALLELDRPGGRALEGHARLLVQARSEEVEVVNRGLVLDLDLVRPRLERLDVLAGLRHLDREARADLAHEPRRRSLAETREGEQCGGDGENGDPFHESSLPCWL